MSPLDTLLDQARESFLDVAEQRRQEDLRVLQGYLETMLLVAEAEPVGC